MGGIVLDLMRAVDHRDVIHFRCWMMMLMRLFLAVEVGGALLLVPVADLPIFVPQDHRTIDRHPRELLPAVVVNLVDVASPIWQLPLDLGAVVVNEGEKDVLLRQVDYHEVLPPDTTVVVVDILNVEEEDRVITEMDLEVTAVVGT